MMSTRNQVLVLVSGSNPVAFYEVERGRTSRSVLKHEHGDGQERANNSENGFPGDSNAQRDAADSKGKHESTARRNAHRRASERRRLRRQIGAMVEALRLAYHAGAV